MPDVVLCSTAGVIKLPKNTLVKASFNSVSDTDWTLSSESGFSLMKVPVTEGVMAEQGSTQQVNVANQWVTASNYRNDAKAGFVVGTKPDPKL